VTAQKQWTLPKDEKNPEWQGRTQTMCDPSWIYGKAEPTGCAIPAGFMPHVDPTICEGTGEGNSLSAQPACRLGWDQL
jgi:hypothetical protein